MKALLKILPFILIIALLSTSATALSLFASFDNNQDTKEISVGEEATYYFTAIKDLSAHKVDVTVNLYDYTSGNLVHKGKLFEVTFTNTFYESPDLKVKASDYSNKGGNYLLDIKAVQTGGGLDKTRSKILYLEVEETLHPPKASFTYTPTQPKVGETVTFTSTSTPGEGRTITKKEWFVEGQKVGEGKTLQHVFQVSAEHLVELKVTNDKGLTDKTRKTVRVFPAPKPPIADFTFTPTHPKVGETVTFTSTSKAGDNPIVAYDWTVQNTAISGPSFQRTFNSPGIYIITHTVTDSIGLTDTIVKTIEVLPPPKGPTADFTFTPANPTDEDVVSFTSTSSAGDNPIVKFEWFVDNQKVGEGTSLQRQFDAGTYQVRLTVTDSIGFVSSRTRTVTVTEKLYPPKANFNFSPSNPTDKDVVTFTSTSTPGKNRQIVKLEWFVDNQKVGEGTNMQRQFDAGSYQVRLTVTNDAGLTDSITRTVHVEKHIPPKGPTADFTFTPVNPTDEDAVTFTSTSSPGDNPIVKFEWFVNNQKVGEGTSLQRQFDAGTYNVRLTVTDSKGLSHSRTRTVTVTEKLYPPKASFTYTPLHPVEEDVVTFTSTSDPGKNRQIVKLEWFVNNQKVGEGKTLQHKFTSPGSYVVRLRVTNDKGLTDNFQRTINVKPLPKGPTADFTFSPSNPTTKDVVTFTSTSSAGDNPIVKFEWFVNNQKVGEGSTFNRQFNVAGSYSVRLTVTDSIGLSHSRTRTVHVVEHVPPKGPTADFTFTPANPTDEDTVTFTSTSSAGDNPIVKYEWFVNNQKVGEGTSLQRQFSAGTYNVRLTVTDSKGLTDSKTRTVTVTKKTFEPPKASFTYSPDKPTTEDIVTFTSTSTPGKDRVIVKEEWFVNNNKIGEGKSIQHQFKNPGNYNVRLTVTNDKGLTDSITKTITVAEVVPPKGPTADFTFTPANPTDEDVVSFTSTSKAGDNPIVKFEWFVNNQKVGEGTSLQRQFSAGTYNVRLTVTDSKGLTDSKTRSITVTKKVAPKGPTADFIYMPSEPFVGQEVVFTSTSKAGDNPIVKFEWFVDSQKVGEGNSLSHVFDKSGSYNVRLTVTDSKGLSHSRTRTVVVQQRQLVLDELSANKDVVRGHQQHISAHVSDALGNDVEGAEVTFMLSHNNQVLGSCDTNFKGFCNINPIIDLPPGNYEVFAEARKPGYLPDLSRKLRTSFKVWEKRYEVKLLTLYEDEFITENYTFYRGTPIYASFRIKDLFTNAYLAPNSGLVEEVFLRVHNSEPLYFDVYTPMHPEEHRYFHEKIPLTDDFLGEGKVFAFVFNFKDGTAGQDSVTVNVLNNPLRFFPPEEFHLKAGESVDIDFKNYVEDVETPPHEVIITHGDTGLLEVSNLGNNIFRIKAPETFSGFEVIMFTADDTDGSVVSKPIKFVVTKIVPPKGPTADFTFTPANPTDEDVVSFTSTSKAGDNPIVKFEWFVNNQKVGEGTSLQRQFSAGTYNVRLTVTDSKGLTDSKTRQVTVSEKPKIGPSASFIYSPVNPIEEENVVFTSTSTQGDAPIVKLEWFVDNQKVGEGESLDYVFNAPGNYNVVLTVTDSNGLTDSASKTVVVSEKPMPEDPVAILKIPGSTIVDQTIKMDASESFDPKSIGITHYEWKITKFGAIVEEFVTSGPVVDYSFEEQGRYIVHLTVRTADDRVGSTVEETFAGRKYGDLLDLVPSDRVYVEEFYVYGNDFGFIDFNDYYFVHAVVRSSRDSGNLRNLRVTFSIPELGIQKRSSAFSLSSGQTVQRNIHGYFDFSEGEIPPGEYYALIGVAGDGISRSKYYPVIIK